MFESLAVHVRFNFNTLEEDISRYYNNYAKNELCKPATILFFLRRFSIKFVMYLDFCR